MVVPYLSMRIKDILQKIQPGIPWVNPEDKRTYLYIEDTSLEYPNRVDIVISKDCPMSFSPVMIRKDGETYDDYMTRRGHRLNLDTVLKSIVTKFWYFEDEESCTGHIGDLIYRGLLEDEEI